MIQPRSSVFLAVALGFVGCTGESVCPTEVDAWEDRDGDGYGDPGAPLGKVCTVEAGMSEDPIDCDDDRAEISPDADETCDGKDENCDGEIDDGFDRDVFYLDHDNDGFGFRADALLACEKPSEEWLRNDDDCDDRNPNVNPDAQEVCGGGDEDCDGLPDDMDPSVDPDTMESWFQDSDRDGLGNRDREAMACDLPVGGAETAGDCDDRDPLVGRRYWYRDADGDGFGDETDVSDNCGAPQGYVDNNLDCDDGDAAANVAIEWYDDLDGDSFGGGAVIAIQCRSPLPGLVADDSDCDDSDREVNPGADDECFDGFDKNCDGSDNCRTCQEWKETDPAAASGTYTLDLPSGAVDVYCDMDTDGGGWTLVMNTSYPYDYGETRWYRELGQLTNNYNWYSRGVWDALRPVIAENSDVRVACGAMGDPEMDVDLSFYDIHWYREWTTSSDDGGSCFNEPGGYDQPAPARRNNLNGETRPLGDDWDAGYLRGEDSCFDWGDFAIDFDNQGKLPGAYAGWGVGDETSWGSADYWWRCGNNNGGYYYYVQNSFYIFVREP